VCYRSYYRNKEGNTWELEVHQARIDLDGRKITLGERHREEEKHRQKKQEGERGSELERASRREGERETALG
jgi:hypothetical protein